MVAVAADEALEPSWLSQILCGCCHREQALRRPQRTWSSQARITAERQWECKKTNLCEEHVSTVFPFLRGRLERMQDFPSICKSLCDCARRRAAESVKGRGLKRNKHQANEACTAHTPQVQGCSCLASSSSTGLGDIVLGVRGGAGSTSAAVRGRALSDGTGLSWF